MEMYVGDGVAHNLTAILLTSQALLPIAAYTNTSPENGTPQKPIKNCCSIKKIIQQSIWENMVLVVLELLSLTYRFTKYWQTAVSR